MPGGNYSYIRQPTYNSMRKSSPSHHRRRRKPSPFLIILIIFVIVLMIVVFTSKGFKNLISSPDDSDTSQQNDTQDTAVSPPETDPPLTKPPETAPPETVAPNPYDGVYLICIDPGHGFDDSGSGSDYLGEFYERDINLMVAKEAYEILGHAGYDVILLHDGETFPKAPDDDGDKLFYIDERVSYSNFIGTDLYVSIHCDTFPDDESVHGTRIYYCSSYKHSSLAEALTDRITAAVNETFPKAKETRSYGKDETSAYYVTVYNDCPSCLIELGFMSNENDASNMLDAEWRHDMAQAIANGIAAYIHENVSK